MEPPDAKSKLDVRTVASVLAILGTVATALYVFFQLQTQVAEIYRWKEGETPDWTTQLNQKLETANESPEHAPMGPPSAVPIGTIVPFFGNSPNPPDGWLYCDGALIDLQRFPDLVAHMRSLQSSFVDSSVWDGNPASDVRTPNLSGKFLRALNHPSRAAEGTDPESGRVLGSLQQDAFKSHSHPYETEGGVDGNRSGQQDATYGRTTRETSPVGDPHETRPKNIGVNFIIRASK